MREFLNIFLLIINIISFVLVLLFGASGIIYELFGPASYEKILQKLKIPWSFERIWLFMFVCLIILIITYILRKKFFLMYFHRFQIGSLLKYTYLKTPLHTNHLLLFTINCF